LKKKTFQKLVVRDSLHLDRQKFITVLCVFLYVYTFMMIFINTRNNKDIFN